MKNETSTVVVRRGGIFLPLLAVLFVGLKLTGFIGWSWWWVLAPLWGPFALSIGLMITLALLAGLCIGGILLGAWIIDKINGR